MEKWEVTLRLRIRKFPFRFRVCFSYEWKAWLLAYELFNVEPEEFARLELDKQVTALAYGAAAWNLIKQGRRIYFTYQDLTEALLRATKEDNQKLNQAMTYAKFPDWLSQGPASGKKKDET